MRHAVLAVGLAASMTYALAAAPAVGADDLVGHESTVRFGTSVQGRPLVAVHRWTTGATRTTLVLGSMHGDERAGTRVVRRLLRLPLPAGVDLWLVPTMNPDGAAAGVRGNARTVDLNRNFPRYWLSAGTGTGTWSGPSPSSEPETRAVQSLLRAVDARTVLSFHQPLHGVDSYRAKSMPLVRRLAPRARPAGAVVRLLRRLPRHADRLGEPPALRPGRDGRAGAVPRRRPPRRRRHRRAPRRRPPLALGHARSTPVGAGVDRACLAGAVSGRRGGGGPTRSGATSCAGRGRPSPRAAGPPAPAWRPAGRRPPARCRAARTPAATASRRC